jgi:dUTP pyrophosphatase
MSRTEEVKVIILPHNKYGIPQYATLGSSGFDLYACISEPIAIQKGYVHIIPVGIKVDIPEGFEIQIRPRSGLAAKEGVTVLNAPATIDQDFRGEIKVILISHVKNVVIEPGMRIAQGVLCPVIRASFVQVEELSDTQRGEGGFGSTGK